MRDASGRWAIVYNGEVFNYVELREELRARGRTFVTESDTEVVLQAWLEWGEAAFERFDGQFALAIWDSAGQTLVLARDRLGVRPLYTCRHAGRVYFASEVKAIFAADATVPRALDPLALDETFTFWTVVAPRTMFAGIEELPPGRLRIHDLRTGQIHERAWFELSFPSRDERPFRGTVDDATELVRDALERSVRLRMLRADVPVGAYLSGGLDSAVIAALAARATPRFASFSLRFEDAEYDEGDYQALMARELGTDHHEVHVRRDDIAGVFADVIEHAERPLLRTAPAPLFMLARRVHDAGIKVVVTGEGADEMFAGYDLFREGKVRRFWASHPSSITRPRLLERLYPYLARSPVAQQAMARKFFGRELDRAAVPGFAHGTRWHTTASVKRLFSADLRAALATADAQRAFLGELPRGLSSWSPLAQDQWIEIRTLLSGYLLSAQGDRMAMAHSVEGRFPFLGRDVIELACRLPDHLKLHVLDEKHVLKRVAKGLVPGEIIARKKQPYRAPDALAFVTGFGRALAEDLLSPAAVARAGVFDPSAAQRLLHKCIAQGENGQLSNADNMALVGAISTQLLHERFVRARSHRTNAPAFEKGEART
jgi:asparagine synthase (glutamine-hydrolysing)